MKQGGQIHMDNLRLLMNTKIDMTTIMMITMITMINDDNDDYDYHGGFGDYDNQHCPQTNSIFSWLRSYQYLSIYFNIIQHMWIFVKN